ncbi:hypothetical protein BDV28DRAFT_139188 [Aspergillus coremiiformis]|uniref:Uncharacterized protein n=1 Tax=Aspergillus coremiiformis TaxID=138285 RepID=A0A5N6Z335_9EURO|nr:hypothetical protein BDV28DRAFT_139188 [Aspergillus coremiiformis]
MHSTFTHWNFSLVNLASLLILYRILLISPPSTPFCHLALIKDAYYYTHAHRCGILVPDIPKDHMLRVS